MIRVQIVERSPIFLAGLIDVFSQRGFQVAGACRSTSEALSWRADVLVIEPGAIHTATVDEFVHTASKIAPVQMMLEDAGSAVIEGYRRAGVAGFVDRTTGVRTLHEVTRKVVEGGQVIGTSRAVEEEAAEPEQLPLSPRERQVLRHVGRGLTHSQIARLLSISRHTVDAHIRRIRRKLDLGNKAELTRAAVLGNLYRA